MKSPFTILRLLVSVSVCSLVLFVSCEKDHVQQLHIQNGRYAILPSTSGSPTRFTVEFEYFVTGEQCQVGGYAIAYDSTGGMTDWYKMQTLSPNVRYNISDTLICSATLTTRPKATMQGYKLRNSDSFPELRAECILVPISL
jgi:hypothetical protein